MKIASALISFILLNVACTSNPQMAGGAATPSQLTGTWKLVKATLVENGDTTITDYTTKTSFIKVINNTHFAFMQHDLNKGKDTTTAVYSSGGGTYTLKDSTYTERLEYCSAREWEGNDFIFTVKVTADSLVQSGIEKVESAGINRLNIEEYVRVK